MTGWYVVACPSLGHCDRDSPCVYHHVFSCVLLQKPKSLSLAFPNDSVKDAVFKTVSDVLALAAHAEVLILNQNVRGDDCTVCFAVLGRHWPSSRLLPHVLERTV